MADLAALIADVPTALRVVVGLIGVVLLVAGARFYYWGLGLAAFAAGAALVASSLSWLATWLPMLHDPMMAGIGAVIGGLAMVWMTRVAHQMAMLAAGALTGLVAGAAAVEWVMAPPWVLLITTLGGALAFPWLYRQLLKVLTPAVGAAVIAWAVGMPDNPILLGALWAFGAAVQSFGGRPADEADASEDEG